MFNHIDSWLLRQHQNIANWTDVRYDKNCYWWGYVLTELLCVCLPAALLLVYTNALLRDTFGILGLSFVTVLYGFAIINELYQRGLRKVTMHLKLPLLSNQKPLFRGMYLLLVLIQFSLLITPTTNDVVWFMILFSWTSRSYFDVCLPMPPHEKEQKRSELFDGIPEGA